MRGENQLPLAQTIKKCRNKKLKIWQGGGGEVIIAIVKLLLSKLLRLEGIACLDLTYDIINLQIFNDVKAM